MNSESTQAATQGHRNRSIRLAVLTSILSKFGTVLLRIISIPVAIRVLGMEEFGVYAAITMVVSMIDMMHVGIGPALTQGIAKALARDDRKQEQGIFATAVILSTVLTVVVSAGLAVVVGILPIATIFGENFAPFAESMRRACLIAIAIVAVELICVLVERARDGYQETRYNNAWGAAGNFLGAAGLIVGVKFFPTVEFLVLALNGSLALAKLANTVHLMLQRSYLWPRLNRFRKALVKPLLGDGARFSVTYLLSAAVEYNAIAYLIGRMVGPEKVGLYNVMITVHFSMTGLIQMITIPLWPAVVDAHSRGDAGWIRKSARRTQLIGPAYGIAALVGLVALGPWAFPLWIGEDFSLGRPTLAVFGAYFTLHLWRHVNQVLLLGIGEVNFAVRVVIVESLAVLLVTVWGLNQGVGLLGVYSGIAICLAALSAWLYPIRFARSMKRWENGLAADSESEAQESLSSPESSANPDQVPAAGAL